MKALNYTIKWKHFDLTPFLEEGLFSHYTKCIIEPVSKRQAAVGMAYCSVSDNFNKDKGRRLSLARAMEDMGLPKEKRTRVWEVYRTMGGKKRW